MRRKKIAAGMAAAVAATLGTLAVGGGAAEAAGPPCVSRSGVMSIQVSDSTWFHTPKPTDQVYVAFTVTYADGRVYRDDHVMDFFGGSHFGYAVAEDPYASPSGPQFPTITATFTDWGSTVSRVTCTDY